jgi:DNA helicase HerA-like ATPase
MHEPRLITYAIPSASLIIGRHVGSLPAEVPVTIPVTALSRHVVIRAGSGSGKTVLLKRLVEEAALGGVPSIVIDGANDLVFLGDRASSVHSGWLPGDSDRAERYHSEADVCVWTPGLSAGRPLRFSALPDFSCLVGANQIVADELDQAVSMAVGSLSEVAGLNGGTTTKLKEAVLKQTLLYFARRGGRTVKELAEVLDQLPPEAGAGIKDAPKLASQIADRIRASVVTDRLLAGDGRGHDPGDLFRSVNGHTRVSIVSLEGLTEEERPRLVDQLAITLFAWIKKSPPSGPSRMNGLLVLDEAQDFLPSTHSTACKQSLMRLAVQARKYGLGLMVATQNPKSLDYNAVSQFSTHFYGKAAAPQAIDVIRKAIQDRGGHAPDIASLDKGMFYFTSSEGWPHPIRIKSPMCLSHHPDQQTATQEQILDRALRSEEG